MRALGIADLHLEPTNMKSRLFRISHVCDIARKRRIQNIFQYGDLVEDGDLTVVRKLRKLFAEYNDLRFWIIAGNHDLFNNREASSCSLDLLRAHNVTVFSSRAEVVDIDGAHVNFNPWPHARLMFDALNVVHAAVPEVEKKLGLDFKVGMKKSDAVTVAGHLHRELRFRNTFYAGTLANNSDPAFHYINYKSDELWKIEKCNLLGYSQVTSEGHLSRVIKKVKPAIVTVEKVERAAKKNSGYLHKIYSMDDLEQVPMTAIALQVEAPFKVKPFSAPNIKRIRILAGQSKERQQELRATAASLAAFLEIAYCQPTLTKE
jgi:hypothetical protein